jgi:AhpD family alkylhydroperoxidase
MKNYPKDLKHYQEVMGNLGKEMPEVMKAFGGLHHAAGSDGTLDAKTKELIALAIAVTVRCNGCIAFHVNDALNAGASREEILDALGVAILMGGGPSVIYSIEAMDALEQFSLETMTELTV